MSRRITFYFEHENILSLTSTDEDVLVGSWSFPYPNTEEDSEVFGLLEACGQSPESPVYAMMIQYGEPVQVVVEEYSPEDGDGARVISDAVVRLLSTPDALAALRENPDDQTARSVSRPARKRQPWERNGYVSEP